MMGTIQLGNLRIDIQQSDLEVIYKFSGDVDEEFRQKEVLRIKKPTIIFDLENVKNFNSVGIREWIYFVRDMGSLGKLKFVRCSVTVIDQINMVPDSLGDGHVESFFAPYYCTAENQNMDRLIAVTDTLEQITRKEAPQLACEKCGKPLEFDALEESYFLFMENTLPKAS